jgi:toxin FitB
MYLLDTNVVSELRRPRPHGAVVAWLQTIQNDHLSISAMTIFELQRGVERARRGDPERAGEIEQWIDRIIGTYRVLPVDAPIARLGAKLVHGLSPDLQEDGLIAATALVHNLTVVTRNLRDFAQFDVPTFDPFKS